MRATFALFLAFLPCVAAWPGAAYAQPQANPNPGGATPPIAGQEELQSSTQAAMEREAAQYFERGRRAYAEGNYAEAAVAFEAAYRLTADPALLYNQYLSCRRSGATSRAADALGQYIQSMPASAERTALEQELRAINLECGRPEEAGITPPTVTPPPTEIHRGPPVGPRRPGRRIARARPFPVVPVVLWSAGGAALVAGTILGITVMSTQSDLESACPMGACDAMHLADVDGARTRALVADILFGTGVALAAAGVVVYLLTGKREEPRPAATVAPGPRLRTRGAGLSVDWSF